MRKKFKLRCDSSNERHTCFTVFDQRGVNCGAITVLTSDAFTFVTCDWNGDVDWNGHILKVEAAS